MQAASLGRIEREVEIRARVQVRRLSGRSGILVHLGLAVLEAAAIVGVQLFDADERALASAVASNTAVMTLIPKSVRASRAKPDDNF